MHRLTKEITGKAQRRPGMQNVEGAPQDRMVGASPSDNSGRKTPGIQIRIRIRIRIRIQKYYQGA